MVQVFFITENGLLLTNAHVVGDAGNVSVILNNGLEIPGRVLRKTESRDVAPGAGCAAGAECPADTHRTFA